MGLHAIFENSIFFFKSDLLMLTNNNDLPICCSTLKSKCNNASTYVHMTFKTYSWPFNKSMIKIKTITEKQHDTM